MIVLLVSANEAQALAAGKPDRALSAYVSRELQLEKLLPDDNLPVAVLLTGVELDATTRSYVATMRLFPTRDAADQAWDEVIPQAWKETA